MNVVARERLIERVEQYADRNPEASLATVLGRFRLDPTDDGDNEERQLVEDVLDRREETDPAGDAVDAEPGGASA